MINCKKNYLAFNIQAWPWLRFEWGIEWEEVVFIWSEHAVLQVCQEWTSSVWELGLPSYNSYVILPSTMRSQEVVEFRLFAMVDWNCLRRTCVDSEILFPLHRGIFDFINEKMNYLFSDIHADDVSVIVLTFIFCFDCASLKNCMNIHKHFVFIQVYGERCISLISL